MTQQLVRGTKTPGDTHSCISLASCATNKACLRLARASSSVGKKSPKRNVSLEKPFT